MPIHDWATSDWLVMGWLPQTPSRSSFHNGGPWAQPPHHSSAHLPGLKPFISQVERQKADGRRVGLEPNFGILGKVFNLGPQSLSSITRGHTLIAGFPGASQIILPAAQHTAAFLPIAH